MAEKPLAEVLEHLVQGLVDRPDQVRITTRETPRANVLEIRVNPRDLGRVIGRNGRTAQSLRAIISSLADTERVRVDVVDVDASTGDA